MTEEEKIRAYDVALDAAKSIYDRMKECQNYGGMEDLEAIFPQLSETEDEKTRKELIGMVKFHASDDDVDRYLAYLEKRKEEKPIFRKGDILKKKGKDYGYTFTVDKIQDDFYISPKGSFIHIDDQNKWELVGKAFLKFKIGDKVNLNNREDENYNIITITSINFEEQCYNCNQGSHIDFDDEDKWRVVEQKPIQVKDKSLANLIKTEFEDFRNLLKKKGIDYEPQQTYWEDFAHMFKNTVKNYEFYDKKKCKKR